MNYDKDLGSIRRENRETIGLSRKYLAVIAGVSEATIMHFERGGRMQYETKSKLLRGYKTATRLYSRRNRMAYMTYIRQYLEKNKIGIVEFSRMVKTGSDIYRDPSLKSFVLATADQIIKIEKATGIKYKEYIDDCDGIREKPATLGTITTNGLELEKEKENSWEPVSIPNVVLGKAEVTVDGEAKHVECTIVGYSAECAGKDHVIYKKKMKRVTTEVIEVEIPADEFVKLMKVETA